jgi:hypothetical protein
MSRGGIRHDVLGFAGLPLLRAHEFVFDHRANTLTLHRMDAQGRVAAPHYGAQDVIASLAFTLPAGQHVPSITLNWDGVIIEGKLDTGNPGTLTLTPAAQRKLRNAGHLRQENGSYTLHGLNYRGTPLIASASTLKVGSANVLGLGQNLLAHYRSVWNFRQQTVILLKPRSSSTVGFKRTNHLPQSIASIASQSQQTKGGDLLAQSNRLRPIP